MCRRKPTLIILFAIAFLVTVGALAARVRQSAREDTAIRLAQEYLREKYPQEMEYRSICFSWIDPSLYHVSFAMADLPEVCFEVLVQSDLTISTETEAQGFSADNCCVKYFEHHMETRLSESAELLWDNGTTITVLQMNSGLYAFPLLPGAALTASLEELEPLIGDYWVYLDTDEALDTPGAQAATANKLHLFFRYLQDSGFCPSTISYNHLTSAGKTDSILFTAWWDLRTPDDILNVLISQLSPS